MNCWEEDSISKVNSIGIGGGANGGDSIELNLDDK